MLAALGGAAFAQSMSNPAMIVKTATYASVDIVLRGQTFEAAVVIQSQPGYHMIRTLLTGLSDSRDDYRANAPAGMTVVSTVYPANRGQQESSASILSTAM
jgi:hypothetical protein